MSDDASKLLSPYDDIGGEVAVRAIAERFYDLMETEPAFAELRAMHGEDLGPMRERLFAFLSGWFGGPRLYNNCVMSAHAPFAIGERERDQWLACMNRAMDDTNVPAQVRTLAGPAFTRMSNAMRRS